MRACVAIYIFKLIYCILDVVNVMCEHIPEKEYKGLFQIFIGERNIRWVPHEENLNIEEKYLLLVDIQTRIPDDVECSLEEYKNKGKVLSYRYFVMLKNIYRNKCLIVCATFVLF